MKKIANKRVICAVLCIVMVLGMSMTSLAYGGSYTCGKHNIAYSTSSTNIYMVATQCSDAYYQFKGTACCTNKAGTAIYKWDIYGGNGVGKASNCEVYNQGPRSGCVFTNDMSSWNSMSLRRTTNLNNGFSSIYTFKYKI